MVATLQGTPVTTQIKSVTYPWTVNLPTGILPGERVLIFLRGAGGEDSTPSPAGRPLRSSIATAARARPSLK